MLCRRLEQDLLVAEAEQADLGWMYLTVEGIDIDSEPDLVSRRWGGAYRGRPGAGCR